METCLEQWKHAWNRRFETVRVYFTAQSYGVVR